MIKIFLAVFAAALFGNLLAYWVVFKSWRFPKIVAVPVAENDPCLLRFRESFKKVSDAELTRLKKRRT